MVKFLGKGRLVMTVAAGANIYDVTVEAVIISGREQRDIEFEFNGSLYRVSFQDLLEQVRQIPSDKK